MEELVLLLVFVLIVLFNVVIKKLAGKPNEPTRKVAERPEVAGEYSAEPKDVRGFLQEIKRRAEEARTGHARPRTQARRIEQMPAEQQARREQVTEVRLREQASVGSGVGTPAQQEKREAAPAAAKAPAPGVRRKKIKKTPAQSAAADRTRGMPAPSGLKSLVGVDRPQLRRAVVMSEVLGKPVGMRGL